MVTANYTSLDNIDWSPCDNKVAYVALSGGIDSVVLLHLAKSQLTHVRAIHINHNLQAASGQWQRFCEQLCQDWHIPLQTVSLDIPQSGNLEAQARAMRYAAIANAIDKNGLLLTAHHGDDLTETLLLQLKRGTGLKGLTSLKRWSRLPVQHATQMLFRPMLECNKSDIQSYASVHNLEWCTDPSNADTTFDRNFLRHTILPTLHQRWPHFSEAVGRTVTNLQEQMLCLDEVVTDKLALCLVSENELDLTALAGFSAHWQSQLLIKFCVQNRLTLSRVHLSQIQAIIASKADAQGQLLLGQNRLYRYRTRLIIELQRGKLALQIQNVDSVAADLADAHTDTDTVEPALPPFVYWDGKYIELAFNIPIDAVNQKDCRFVDIALSEKITPVGAAYSKPIKQWCKLWDIPPWHRQPLQLFLYREYALALVSPFIVIPLSEHGQYRVAIANHHLG